MHILFKFISIQKKMKIRNFKIKLCHIPKELIRIKCSILASGIIFLFLGIQGIFNMQHNKKSSIPNIEILTYLLFGLGVMMISISSISCQFNNNYENLLDPDYQNI